MKIKVITEYDSVKFSTIVNKHIENEWELFGEPKIETVVTKNMWGGQERNSTIHTVYHQILKTKT